MKLIKCKKEHYGPLAKGCKQCIKGRKSVLFITGFCHYECFYCPISDDKRHQDVVKINEHVVHNPDSDSALDEIFKEIRLCSSKGIGVTGGDPLAKHKRTIHFIRSIKKEFGKQFHIHLYTSPQYLTKEKLQDLESVGLDEIRFHLNVEDDSLWDKILLAKDMKFDIGVEIPVLPDKLVESKNVLDFCKQSNIVSFVNLNELEFSDISDDVLKKRGYFVKSHVSYGIHKSEDAAIELIKYAKSIRLRTHYCSCSFKDAVQLGNRFLRRAKNVALPLDIVDKEGMLTRGEIIINPHKFSKHKNINEDLNDILFTLQDYFELSDNMARIEDGRILIASWILKDIWKNLYDNKYDFEWVDLVDVAIVKEYPTDDHFIVEKELL